MLDHITRNTLKGEKLTTVNQSKKPTKSEENGRYQLHRAQIKGRLFHTNHIHTQALLQTLCRCYGTQRNAHL